MSRRLVASELNVSSGHEACLARTSVFLVSDRSSGAYLNFSLKYTQIRNASKTRASQRMTPRIVARTSRSARGRRARSRAMAATDEAYQEAVAFLQKTNIDGESVYEQLAKVVGALPELRSNPF
jgi:hypothetical protein